MSGASKDWRAIAKQAAQANGALAKARPGAVFSLAGGEIVTFPEDRLPGHPPKTTHGRRVIIVQAHERCTGTDPLTVLVVPCTASFRGLPGPYEYEVPDGEPGFTKDSVVALCSLLQPVLKADLARFEGQIRPQTLLALEAVIAENLALLATPTRIVMPERALDLPPSIPVPVADAVDCGESE